MQDTKETERTNQQEYLALSAHTLAKVQAATKKVNMSLIRQPQLSCKHVQQWYHCHLWNVAVHVGGYDTLGIDNNSALPGHCKVDLPPQQGCVWFAVE